jgi:phage-related protein
MEIKFFDQSIEDLIGSLERITHAKTLRILDLLEKYGSKLSLPYSKKIGRRLFELRIRGKNEVRIIYTFYKNQVVLLHAFIKKSRRITKRDLDSGNKKLFFLDAL